MKGILDIRKNINKLLAISLLLCNSPGLWGQSADAVLHKGELIKRDEIIILKYDSVNVRYTVINIEQKKINPSTWNVLENEQLFLSKAFDSKVYTVPTNPLRYNWKSEIELIVDPIEKDAKEAFSQILEIVEQVKSAKNDSDANANSEKSGQAVVNKVSLKNLLEELPKKDKKVLQTFNKLKHLSFDDKESTEARLLEIEVTDLDSLRIYFTALDDAFEETLEKLDALESKDLGTSDLLWTEMYKELSSEYLVKKRTAVRANYEQLLKAKKSIDALKKEAGEFWRILLKEVKVNAKENAKVSINVSSSTVGVTDKQITAKVPKELKEINFLIRKYQIFIPEVSAGIIYSDFAFQNFGTSTDSAGQQVVSEPVEDMLRDINLSVMLNYNLWIPNSNVHPLLQIGAGINTGMPTFAAGVGLRTSLGGEGNFAISYGVAMTWLRTLNTLKPGDVVSGTADIEADFRYNSSPDFRPYIGIQYNFGKN